MGYAAGAHATPLEGLSPAVLRGVQSGTGAGTGLLDPGAARHLGKITLGLIPGAARVASERVTRVSQAIRDFLSEPQPKLVLFPFMPVLLHLTCSPCVSVRSSACQWPPGVCVGRQHGGVAQQALVYGLNSLVK